MKLQLITIVVTFLLGTGFGILLHNIEILVSEQPVNIGQADGVDRRCSSTQELPGLTENNDRPDVVSRRQKQVSDSEKNDIGTSISTTEEQQELNEFLVRYPPPHISDPYFFGPTEPDEESQLLREQLFKEHIASLREAGASEQDIQSVIDEFENDFTNNSSGSDSTTGNAEVSPSPEEQAYDLAQSLVETGESPENIQQMVDDLKLNSDMNGHMTAEHEMIDPETGLDHPRPEMPIE